MDRYQKTVVDDRIRRLESDLWEARHEIVQLMPANIVSLLSDYHSCVTLADFESWERDVIDRIVSLAPSDPEAPSYHKRAYCPLCKGGSSGFYEQGFALPEGLRRHLTGYGNARQCPVVKAAFANARLSLQDIDWKADKTSEETLLRRRIGETLYLVDPRFEPRLIEQGIWTGKTRDLEQMRVTERRLQELGFDAQRLGNVMSYKMARGPYGVLADPRELGRITFCVYLVQDHRKHTRPEVAYFYLLDNWKNDLLSKFNARFASAVASLKQSAVVKLA